ncbi:Uu.00g014500.m01.CDS01 [Anthostomella pinea]|uniref:Uu.00g014500.m01.CDS01 n=1 Tax=Anthostomella pinea TaxID=933095 RepID=A0AAI8VSK4_9PEZI|nr:Uu.00g014500.m01.CDS01 [Anthostomella pinea]
MASVAASDPGASPIEQLATELQQAIMQSLLDMASLFRFTATSRAIRSAFDANPGVIFRAVSRNESSGYLWPLAVARAIADERGREPPKDAAEYLCYEERVKQFFHDNLRGPGCNASPSTAFFTPQLIKELKSFHSIALEMADEIGDEMSEIFRLGQQPMDDTGKRHLVKAIYLLDLMYGIVPWDHEDFGQTEDDLLKEFWTYFAPWECSQTVWFHSWLSNEFDVNYGRIYLLCSQLQRSGIRYLYRLDFNKLLDPQSPKDAVDELAAQPDMRKWRVNANPYDITSCQLMQWLVPTTNPNGRTVYSLDIRPLIERFPETDTGPRDFWWFRALAYVDGYPTARQDFLAWDWQIDP